MAGTGDSVLYGDSTASILPSDILDVLTRFVDCGAAVAGAFQELGTLTEREQARIDWTDDMVEDLAIYQRHVEGVLSTTPNPSARGEIMELGNETLAAALRTVDHSRRRYLGQLERERSEINTRRGELMEQMRAAIETFVLPLRARMPRRIVARLFDGTRYRDEALFELVEGIRPRLSIETRESDVPRKVRSLMPRGAKVHVGTRARRLRKVEEPAVFVLDELSILEMRVAPDGGHIVLAKKFGARDVLRLELTPQADGSVAAVGQRSDGVQAALPPSDRAVLGALWTVMKAEAERVMHSPARLSGLRFDGRDAAESHDMVAAIERVATRYRPIVAEIARRSPNADELSIKIARPDGRREEAWIERAALQRPLAALDDALRLAVDISVAPAQPIFVAEVPSAPIYTMTELDVELLDDDAAVPLHDVTHDISLGDLELMLEATPTPGTIKPSTRFARRQLPRPRMLAGELKTGRFEPVRSRPRAR